MCLPGPNRCGDKWGPVRCYEHNYSDKYRLNLLFQFFFTSPLRHTPLFANLFFGKEKEPGYRVSRIHTRSLGRDCGALHAMNATLVGWVPEPDGRGTARLITSCIFTIFLSTWTAYHQDMKRSWSVAFWDKVLVTIGSIFAPECIICLAICDWNRVKKLQFIFRNIQVEVCMSILSSSQIDCNIEIQTNDAVYIAT